MVLVMAETVMVGKQQLRRRQPKNMFVVYVILLDFLEFFLIFFTSSLIISLLNRL